MFSIIDAEIRHPAERLSSRAQRGTCFQYLHLAKHQQDSSSFATLGMTALLYGIASFQHGQVEWITTKEPENPIHEASRHATPPASGAADADRTWGSDPPTCHP
ncbi:MAG: hypothetical protein V4673_10095 [Pseudomonadota bacterium]